MRSKCGIANKYKLQYYFDSTQEAIETIKNISGDKSIKEVFLKRAKLMVSEKDDFNEFLFNAIQGNWK